MDRSCYLYGGTEPYKKSSRCSGGRKKTGGHAQTKMGRGMMEETRKLVERNRKNVAGKRDSWQKLLEKVLAQKELLCQ
jgi:molybdenum-dependent DNA-binding transcriptional regulator ModE